MTKKITRQELSAIITELRGDQVTVRQIIYNETRWGLKPARGKDLNRRVIRYDKELALSALRSFGLI